MCSVACKNAEAMCRRRKRRASDNSSTLMPSAPICAKLVHDYGDASIAAAFLIPQDCDTYYLEYLLRRYKGHFYRNRYPSLSIVDA